MTNSNQYGFGEKAVCIRAGWLIDGIGNEPQTDVSIYIRSGKFQAVESPRGREKVRADVVDLGNATVIPGLVDCHAHLAMSGTDNPHNRKEQLEMEYKTAARLLQRHLDAHRRYGIVAIRDGGDQHGYALQYVRELSAECENFKALRCAGHGWRKPGRYGKMIAKSTVAGTELFSLLEMSNSGGSHIKVLNSGVNSLTEYGKETEPQFTKSEMVRFVRAAANLNRPVMVHANGRHPVRIAVEAGCLSIEHGYFMGTENLKRMAEKKTFWVPTLVPMAVYHSSPASETEKAIIAGRTLVHQLEQLHQARREGVRVAVGTDAGSFGVHHGVSVYQEMRLLMEAGYGVHEAVRCASTEGASLLGLDAAQPFEKGNPAVFIVVDGPPEQLRENVLQVRIFNGEGFRPPVRVRTGFQLP